MKITTTENNEIQLEEVFNSIILKTSDGEEMAICMRDSGFEFQYQDKWYSAKEGQVIPLSQLKRGKTQFHGTTFHYKDGTSELVTPQPELKKAVEDMINVEEE